ncbi:MAG TPA: MFS transporter [Burkholderiales bacterium]|nr:MFS transporter [Burkholderiales bacterium]
METRFTPEFRRSTMAKISWRLLPLVVFAYLVAYIDRTNVSVASLTMNKQLGIDPFYYGLGAGIFFIGYALFEIPSNIILEKVGARLWIARIMITWGIVSGLMAATVGPWSFVALRFALGVAEAGFFPGMILYFTYWYPAAYRGRVISTLFIAVPLGNAIASVLSGAILEMDGIWGLHGWQWVFIVEAIPAVLLAFVVLKYMTDRPSKANWLDADQKDWIEGELAAERRAVEASGKLSVWQVLTDRRVLAISAIYFFSATANYGITFFLPQIVKGIGSQSNFMTSLLSAIPYLVGVVGLLAFGHSSDKHNERRRHLITAATIGGIGFAIAASLHDSYWALVGMSIATVGTYGCRPTMWPMPSFYLTGAAAAVGIALINSIGNIGGYVGPFVVGWIKNSTQSFEMAVYFLSACSFTSALIAYCARSATGARPASASTRHQTRGEKTKAPSPL